jgi:cell wall-associated NlpC family hydrolase
VLVSLFAVPSGRAASPVAVKQAQAAQVFGEIQTLGASLGVADERINLANLELTHVQGELAVNQQQLRVARTNLTRSQQAIAKLIEEVKAFKGAVERHGRELSNEKSQAARLLAERRDERASIATQIGERQRLLVSIKSEIGKLEAEQRARQLAQARAAQRAIAAAQARQERLQAATIIGASATVPEITPSTAPELTPAAPSLSYGTQIATVVPPSSYGNQVVAIAMSFLGTPYVWGGAAPGGFDCSGLVMYSFAQLGVSLPHSSYAMWNYGVPVPEDQLEPGDLVFFDGLGHVGLYVGGGDYIDAPYTGVDVRIDSLADPWAAANYVGARRIL